MGVWRSLAVGHCGRAVCDDRCQTDPPCRWLQPPPLPPGPFSPSSCACTRGPTPCSRSACCCAQSTPRARKSRRGPTFVVARTCCCSRRPSRRTRVAWGGRDCRQLLHPRLAGGHHRGAVAPRVCATRPCPPTGTWCAWGGGGLGVGSGVWRPVAARRWVAAAVDDRTHSRRAQSWSAGGVHCPPGAPWACFVGGTGRSTRRSHPRTRRRRW